jgi:hypothetical protein
VAMTALPPNAEFRGRVCINSSSVLLAPCLTSWVMFVIVIGLAYQHDTCLIVCVGLHSSFRCRTTDGQNGVMTFCIKGRLQKILSPHISTLFTL